MSADQEVAQKAGEVVEEAKKTMDETKTKVEDEMPKKKAAKSG